jgi:hypothetical protein
MGVFVFEAAHAGAALGPRAIVKAITKAINFLGVAHAEIALNILFLRPAARVKIPVQELAEEKPE